MGIDGLLKLLQPITQKEHISSFKNQRAGVDIMPWIYHGCYSCSYELNQNIESIKFLYYLLEMIEMLSYYNIRPIFVFDGKAIDLKAQTNEKRKKTKEQYKAKGLECLKEGRLDDARRYFSRSLFIDERIIRITINVLTTKNLDFLIAPYEADCQIAKLKKLNLIDVAISEDSDLLAYGVNTILKLNQNGDCDYVDVEKWRPRDVDSQFLKEYLVMNKINKIEAAILAGSDYNPSVRGIGIKRAVRNLYRQGNMKNVINKLRSEKVYMDKIPQDYVTLVQKVKLIFLFATVFNPETQELQALNPQLLEEFQTQSIEGLDKIVGEKYPEYIEKQVYCGKAQPKSFKQRNIEIVNIRQIFTVNRENLSIHEAMNSKRRREYQQVREEREHKIEEGLIQNVQLKPKKKHQSKPKKELSEKEREQRKTERKNRIMRLHDMMNSVVEGFQEESEDKSVKEKSEKDSSSEYSDEDSQSEKSLQNVNLGFLNPFAKAECHQNSAKKE